MRCAGAAAVLILVVSTSTLAQDHAAHQPPAASGEVWQWRVDANVFFGFNSQQREFRDFNVWESFNWLMASAERPISGARLSFDAMFSFEPFTLRDIGSPQVFQTGETFNRAALIDYQHPHDLFMGLGGEVRVPYSRATMIFGADLVGPPTLGPPVFMHRASAVENPTAPLAHHHLDATHITHGVLRAGVEARGLRVEGSVFQGREPDEDRLDLDFGALDSYALRVSWTRGPWYAQASGGWLNEPEFVTPFDATRLTGSISFTRGDDSRMIAWTAAFGQNREIHGNLEAYLFEATWRLNPGNAFYTRAESVDKDILDVGFHPVTTFHPHRQSRVGALTLGYVREILRAPFGAFGLGADVTGYTVPANLSESYGQPVSYHAFVRFRTKAGTGTHLH